MKFYSARRSVSIDQGWHKPGFYHKAQPGGFYEGGFLFFFGFYVGFINLKVNH